MQSLIDYQGREIEEKINHIKALEETMQSKEVNKLLKVTFFFHLPYKCITIFFIDFFYCLFFWITEIIQ